jgi:uncharacterized protein YkwD
MQRARFAILVLVVLTVVAVGQTSAASGQAQQSLDVETGILAELNAVRAARGLRPLTPSPGLQAAAAAHSRAMLQRGFFNHSTAGGPSFSDRMQRFYPSRGFMHWNVAENILYHSAELGAAEAVAAWMNSPPHRQNMLGTAWREVGIGALWAASAPGQFGGSPTFVVTLDFGVRTGKTHAR